MGVGLAVWILSVGRNGEGGLRAGAEATVEWQRGEVCRRIDSG